MKKFLALFLALVLVLGLVACGGNKGGSGDDSGLTADGKVKLTIGLPSSATVISHDENALTKWIEEKCGVELSFVEYAGGTDISTQITTTIAGRQELPDILWGMHMEGNTLKRYGDDGYFVNLKDYFADKEGASKIFWDRMEENLSEEDQRLIINTITDSESGNIYAVPAVEISTFDRMRYQAYINTKWLDKLNLEMPTDTESLYKVLKAFKEGDPNGNGKADEIPIFGSIIGGLGANCIDWLINMFVYYNSSRAYTVGEDGKLSPTYTSDAYREALKYINKLYKEELLTALAWTASGTEIGSIASPSSGTALCGIFTCHLSSQYQKGNELMYEYAPLPYWGCTVREDTTCSQNTFITEDCKNPDKAFEVLMTCWSEEGSMRIRYGEYGVNWTDPTPGAKSIVGWDADYKLIKDPLGTQNSCKWSKMASMLNMYAECETAELAQEMNQWDKDKYANLAKVQEYFDDAAAKNNPKVVCPKLFYTTAEDEKVEITRTNVNDYYKECQTDFCVGKMDPNSDADWNKYLAELDKLGLKDVIAAAQVAYDRG